MDEPRDPDLDTVLDRFREVLLESIHTKRPGTITAYDPVTQLASAQPIVQERRLAEDGDTLVPVSLPASHRCPVVFPRGVAGGLTYPVRIGDVCVILYASSSIARWVARGGEQVDPGDDRHHDLSDALVIVGGHPSTAPTTDAPTDAVVIHAAADVSVKLGASSATQRVPLGDALVGAINTLAGKIRDAVAGLAATNATAQAAIITSAIAAFNATTTLSAITKTV